MDSSSIRSCAVLRWQSLVVLFRIERRNVVSSLVVCSLVLLLIVLQIDSSVASLNDNNSSSNSRDLELLDRTRAKNGLLRITTTAKAAKSKDDDAANDDPDDDDAFGIKSSRRNQKRLFARFAAQQNNEKPSSQKSSSSSSNEESNNNSSSTSSAVGPSNQCDAAHQSQVGDFSSANKENQHQQQQNSAKSGSANSGDEFPGSQQQLSGFTQIRPSQQVKPNFYTLRLKLDPNKRKFSGQLMIALDVSAERSASTNGSQAANSAANSESAATDGSRYLTLHAGANLHIRKAFYVFTARSSAQIKATKIGRNLDGELLTLDFYPNSISAGPGLLLLVYTGLVNETDSHGLFLHRSQRVAKKPTGPAGAANKAINSSNNHNQFDQAPPVELFQTGLATHMQPSFARRLFPSWDEPQLKARFSLIVVLPFRGYECISNMPIKRKSISLSCSGEPLQEVEFYTTPSMSTYLLALVIGRFEHIESITPNNCKIRAYFYANQLVLSPRPPSLPPSEGELAVAPASNHRRQAAQMALELAVRSFDHLENLLAVKYPLDKFDMIALREFNSGGMENWGAAIFHENYLLCDNTSQHASIRVSGGSARPKRLVVPLVVAHEIAHQWFGNLITPKSWVYLWLNEGFAQLLMYQVAAELFPQQDYWSIFMEDSRKSAMSEDELITSSRALEPEEAQLASLSGQMSLFDQLTYNKGALLVRMVEFALGPEEFYAALRHYLIKHSYDSVTSHDLWQALEESNGRQERQIESLMENWLRQEGFPLLSVAIWEQPDGEHYLMELKQERFTLLPGDQASARTGMERNESKQQQQQQQVWWSNWTWPMPITLCSELKPRPSRQDLRLWPTTSSDNQQQQQQQQLYQRGPTNLIVSNSGTIISGQQFAFVFTRQQATVQLSKASLGQWFKLNFNASGYFRVHYSGAHSLPSASSAAQKGSRRVDMLERLVEPIRGGQVSSLDRFNLLDDLFALVLAGRESVDRYLQFIWRAYDQETDILVLRSIFDSFERIKLALVSNDAELLATWLASSAQSSSAWGRGEIAASRLLEPASDTKLARLFDLYVQKFARKVSTSSGSSVVDPSSASLAGLLPLQSPPATSERDDGPHVSDASSALQANDSGGMPSIGIGNFHVNPLFSMTTTTTTTMSDQQQQRAPTKLSAEPLTGSEAQPRLALAKVAPHQQSAGSESQQQSAAATSGSRKASAELNELLDSLRASYNDQTLAQWASPLVSSHFRRGSPAARKQQSSEQQHLNQSSSAASYSAVELMGRELRASIYALALNSAAEQQQQQQAGRLRRAALPGADGNEHVANNSAASRHSKRHSSWPSGPANSPKDFYSRLLDLYAELAQTLGSPPAAALESSTERNAIVWALGSSRNSSRQLQLLELALGSSLFRQQDVVVLLESMARSLSGRQLIWLKLCEQSKLFAERQLLSTAIKSVSKGLIELSSIVVVAGEGGGAAVEEGEEKDKAHSIADNNNSKRRHWNVEQQLRLMYNEFWSNDEHGKLIGQTIEWLRINTDWYKRDRRNLQQMLEQQLSERQ